MSVGLAQIGVEVGSRVGSALLARLIAGKRKEVDLVTPAINESQAQLADLASQQRQQQALLESDLSRIGSAGFSGAAARENLLSAGAQAGASLRGSILDTLARARQQQELINTEAANTERIATIQGITGAGAAVGSGASDLLGQGELLAAQNSGAPTGAIAAAAAPAAGIPIAASVQPMQTPAPNIQDLKANVTTQRYTPALSNVVDYDKMNRRIFNSLQVQ